MHSANRFPVLVYDRDAREAYKSGGLAAKARDVADAGRFDDTHIIHVTDDELEMLRQQWGDPTINPRTGMPEFGIFGSIFKVFKKIAPIAAFAVPVIGPALGTALGVGATAGTALAGAGLGALSGGGLKGAALGALTGGLGASGAPGKIGGAILGQGATQATKNALGQALISGGTGALSGQNPLTSALGGAAQGYFMTPRTTGTPTTTTAPATAAPASAAPASAAPAAAPTAPMAVRPAYTPPSVGSPAKFDFGIDAATQAMIDKAAAGDLVATTAAKPNWWNRDVGFLGKFGRDLGIKNKHAALVGGLLAAGAIDAAKPKNTESDTEAAREKFFGSGFSQSSLNAPGNFKLASVARGSSSGNPMEEYSKNYFNYAAGGDVESGGRSGRGSFAVRGPGDGRSDEIPAMLSDGEYVIDAETVALLGNGSPKAGAKRLDDLRVKIRKHKGKKLAKGKFSPDAKPAERYMAGGRI